MPGMVARPEWLSSIKGLDARYGARKAGRIKKPMILRQTAHRKPSGSFRVKNVEVAVPKGVC